MAEKCFVVLVNPFDSISAERRPVRVILGADNEEEAMEALKTDWRFHVYPSIKTIHYSGEHVWGRCDIQEITLINAKELLSAHTPA